MYSLAKVFTKLNLETKLENILLEKERNSGFEGGNLLRLYDAIVQFYIKKQNFNEANKYLQKGNKLKEKNSDWPSYKSIIDTGISNEQAKSEFYAKNPFLKSWDNEFKGNLSLQVNFSVNSAVIPISAYSELNKAAAALKKPGGDSYIFQIEGHTDNTGSNDINTPLSLRRAQSIKEYFVNESGINATRLQTFGFGSSNPIATNNSEKGKKQNRRVDIQPYGNINSPEIAIAGGLNTSQAVFSPNGKYMATGTSPITLWDIKQKIKIRELSIGSKHTFSPNSRYLATISNRTDYGGVKTNSLRVVDVKTGVVEDLHTLVGSGEKIANFSWSPYGDEIAYSNNYGMLSIYSLKEKKVIHIKRISSMQIESQVHWFNNGQSIVAAPARGNTLYVFDANNLNKIHEVNNINWTHAIGESYDNKKLIIASNNRTLTTVDTSNFQVLNTVRNGGPTPWKFISVPGKPIVLMDSKFDNQIGIYDYQKNEYLNLFEPNGKWKLGISPDGENILMAADEQMFTLSLDAPETAIDGFESQSFIGQHIYIDKKNDYLLTEDSGGTNVWEVATGKRIHSYENKKSHEKNFLSWRQIELQQDSFISVNFMGEVLKLSSTDFTIKKVAQVDYEPAKHSLQGKYYVVTGRDRGTVWKPTGKDYVTIFDSATYEKISSFEVDLVNEPIEYGVRRAWIADIAIDPVSQSIAFSTWWDDGGAKMITSKTVQLFDINSGKFIKNVLSNFPVENGLFFNTSDETLGEIQVLGKTWQAKLNLSTGKMSEFEPLKKPSKTLDDGSKLSWGLFEVFYNDKKISTKERIAGVVVDKNRNLLVVYTKGNNIIYYSLSDLDKRLTINSRKNNQWIAYTESGYFDASAYGTNGVYWTFGDRYLPFNTLKEKFEKPYLVKNTINQLFLGKKQKKYEPIVEPDVLDMPFKVSLINDRNSETTAETIDIKLKVEKTDKNLPDPDFSFTINGRKTRGFEEDPFYDGNESVQITRNIPLGIGQNNIVANLIYKGVTVHSERVTVTRKDNRQESGNNGELWFFGVGISEYKKVIQNLDFADRDAIELEKVFRSQEGKLFSKVNTKVLVNDNATARDVQIQMNEFLNQAKAEDTVIVFIAGHGVQDSNQNLYFMAHDSDLRKPYTGVQVEDFKNFLEQRPINQKAIFLLDICHAGSVNDQGNKGRIASEYVVKKLMEGTATTVFASSTGAQQSLEDESFGGGHGAFTFALIEALKGQGDKVVGDEDGYTSLLELITYTMKEVPKITKQAQRPVFPTMVDFKDYPLSKTN